MVGDKEEYVVAAASLLLYPRTFAQEKELIQQASTGRIVKCSNLSGVNFKSLVS